LVEIIHAVEGIKREKWETFIDRHGDWGRDLALYLGRKDGGLKLRALGRAAGLGATAVNMAVRRASAKIRDNPALAAALKQCRNQLQM
jgi:hypothetical protein